MLEDAIELKVEEGFGLSVVSTAVLRFIRTGFEVRLQVPVFIPAPAHLR